MVGIIFSNIYDSTFGELTSHRTVASLPFGGRYRQIDFVLSNMVNSNITNIGLITKYNYQSLMDHLGSCQEWDLNRKNGGLFILPPFASGNTGIYRGKLEALHVALQYLKNSNEEYVLISDCINLCNIDYRPVLEAHIKSGCDITVIANRAPISDNDDSDDISAFVIKTDANSRATEIALNYNPGDDSLFGMGMFIIERHRLIDVVTETVAKGLYHLERDFIQRSFNNGTLSVNVYEFKGVTLRNTGVEAYFKNNLLLIKDNIRNGLFLPEAPIYTKVRDEIPTYYGELSKIENCIIADGCLLEGTASNSVLFRDVSLAKNSEVCNSIIMQGSVIDEGAYLEYAILDKNVHVTAGTRLIGTRRNPIIIKKGETA